jgi:quercetin dioxygenase-like cupin family protein
VSGYKSNRIQTTILTGLRGEKMMMVFNTTLPGHTVPIHSHPHQQIGLIYAGKAVLRIGEEPFVMLDIFYPVRED